MGYNNSNNKGGYNNFDLNNYETVKSRKVRLRTDHKNAFVMPFPMSDLNFAGNYIMMGALIWKDKKTLEEIDKHTLADAMEMASKANPQNAGLILTTIGASLLADGVGFSLSVAGGKGADKNAWVENAEESAVGRALDNMGYHSGSASQEEMKKVQHMESVQKDRVRLENQINAMYGTLMQMGHNPQYITQVIQQSVKSFNQLSELSVDELDKLLTAMQSMNNQQQPQQPPPQHAPQGLGGPAPR